MNSAGRFEDHPMRRILIAAFAIFVLLGRSFSIMRPPKAPRRQTKNRSPATLEPPGYEPGGGLRGDEQDASNGIFFGKSASPDYGNEDGGLFSASRKTTHHLAKTRAGKGTRVICPTCFATGSATSGSCIVIDPERGAELNFRKNKGAEAACHVINPWGELASTYAALGFQSATFNRSTCWTGMIAMRRRRAGACHRHLPAGKGRQGRFLDRETPQAC